MAGEKTGEKELLIAGIDPGTTVGYAAISFEGDVIKLHSEKNLDLNTLISELIRIGRPLIIAGDKQHNPGLVEKLGVKLGARVISPDYDLKVGEKREITKGFSTKNQHEIDALASAFFALKKIGPLLKKISIFTEHYKKEDIKQQLIEFVVGKGLSIKDAAEVIEEPEKEETKIIREVVEEKRLSEKDFLRLYKLYNSSKQEVSLLKKENRKLKDEITAVKEGYGHMLSRISKSNLDKRMQSLLDFKEKRIRFLDSQLKKKEEEISSMQNEITSFIYFLSALNSSVLLKKMDNLGLKEFEKKEDILNIREGDILLVKDPDIVSERKINEIKDKVSIIFYKKPVSRKIESGLPFMFIDSNGVNIEENKYFGILDKEEFERVKNKRALFNKIIEEYKEERIKEERRNQESAAKVKGA